jgi:cob(I)alamin adenosyltransferase
MNTQEFNRQEIEAELELIQEKLAVVNTKVKSSATDAQISYAEQIEALDKQTDTAKAKLKILDETSDDTLEQFICGVGICLSALRSAVRETAAKFKD